MLDELCEPFKMGACEYPASQVLKAVDPIAYEVGKDDFEAIDDSEA